MLISFSVNGERRSTEVEGDESLLFVLRERFGLTGTKNACEQGECGSCGVLVNGVLVNSCLELAARANGSEVLTVEGLATDGVLHVVQEAFLDAGAVQCGFCTPGLLMAVIDLVARQPHPSESVVREELSGHLCRCTGYEKIVDAALLAAARASETRS